MGVIDEALEDRWQVPVPGPLTFAPFAVLPLATRQPCTPAAYDWIEIIAFRHGSGRLVWGDGGGRFRPGDTLVLLDSVGALLTPDGEADGTRLLVDTDFFVRLLRWVNPRFRAVDGGSDPVLELAYPQRAQLLRPDAARFERFCLLTDEVARLADRNQLSARPLKAVALVTGAMALLSPLVRRSDVRLTDSAAATDTSRHPGGPRVRGMGPARSEVLDAKAWIREHYAEAWKVKDLAAMVHLSSSQLCRLFCLQIGKTITTYRDSMRVNRMCDLLTGTDKTVEQIAKEVGWGDVKRASKVFTEVKKKTPATFRKTMRESEARELARVDLRTGMVLDLDTRRSMDLGVDLRMKRVD
jgi:AraC-like DNA-binding protein